MAVCINSAALNGIDALIIHIETRITPGVQYFIVGLPDESVKESLIRVESAISSADLNMPRQKIVISMAPGDGDQYPSGNCTASSRYLRGRGRPADG